MRKTIYVLLSVLILFSLLSMASTASAAEVQLNDTVSFAKSEQIEHTNNGSYPVFESIYRYKEIENVKSLNSCATVETTASGWIVKFVKSGTAKIEVRSHVRESYSKYNTEEQVVYKNYNMTYAAKTETLEYTVSSLADAYVVPDGYVGVYKDGHEYIDFASQEVINAKFGSSTLIRYANLQDFFGFSYEFKDNAFHVTLNNFTGNGLYFRCPKKDTHVMITLKGKNTLNGSNMAFNKESPFSAIVATGEKSVIWITAGEKNAELNVNLEAVKNKNDSAGITHIVPFYGKGGTQVETISENTPPTVNVNLTTGADALGDRKVNLALGNLYVVNSNFNYVYNTNGDLKNYSGVGERLFLKGDTIFTGTMDNKQYTGNAPEYLFPKITYASDFTGGAYFTCTGGKLVGSMKDEVFIPNSLLYYETTVGKTQYRAVTASNDKLLARVTPANIAPAFPDVRVGQELPKLMDGTSFIAGLTWTNSAGENTDYADKNQTYSARATFVPKKGCYIYVRNLSAADKAAAKPASVSAVSNIPLPNTTTTAYDKLDFQLHKIQAGSPTITKQPASVLADPGETVTFSVVAANANPNPDGYEWHSVTNVKFLGVTIPWDTKLSDNSVYSGTKTSSLKVTVNSNLYKVRYYYCKVNGVGWNSVQSGHVTITQPKRITRITLGGMQEPLPGNKPVNSYAYGFDYDNIAYSTFFEKDMAPSLDNNTYTSASNSPAAKLDYSGSESMTDGCFWYKGASDFSKTPQQMPKTEAFQQGGTYTYRFRVLAKTGYKFSDDVVFTHDTVPTLEAHSHKVSDTEYLIDFTYENLTHRIPETGESLIFLNVPTLAENGSFTESASVQDGAGYTLTAQEGWLESPESTETASPTVGGVYYLHYTLVAKEGYSFTPATSDITSTVYNADDGKSVYKDATKYVISDASNTQLEVYLGFKCTQKRVKDLSLKGLPVPSVGDKLVTTAGVNPNGVTVTSVKYYDASFSELPATYAPKAKELLTVSVFVKANDGLSFDPNASMTWSVPGNILSANAKKDAGMAENERRFDFNVSVHVHEWAHIEDVAYLTASATCTNGTTYYESCVFCGAQGSKTFEMNDKTPHLPHPTAAKAATCTADGNTAYFSCLNCGKLFSDEACTKEIQLKDTVVKAAGHKYGAWTKLDDSQHQRVCANDKTHVEKDAHTWDAGTVTKAATVTEEGVRTFKCTVCAAEKTETIAKLPADHTHKYDALKHDDANHWYECSCGAAKDKAAHTWDAGTVSGDKTTYKCTVCGATKTVSKDTPPEEADYALGDVDNNGKIESADARLALRIAVGLEPTMGAGTKEYKAANVDKVAAGKVEAADARLILRKAVSYIDAEFGA